MDIVAQYEIHICCTSAVAATTTGRLDSADLFYIFVCSLKLVLWHRIMVLLVVVMPREYDMYNNRRMFFYIKAPNLNCDSGMKKKYDC